MELPTILIDTREQTPLEFTGLHIRGVNSMPTKVQKLDEGDYSVEGLEDILFIERKSVNDLYGTIFKGRERFERELTRAQKQQKRYLIIEATPYLFLKYLQNHDKMHMYNAAIATLESFAQKYDLRIRWLKTREGSAEYVAKLAIRTKLEQEAKDEI